MMIRTAVVEDCRPEAEALLGDLSAPTAPGDSLHTEIFASGEEFLEAAKK